MTTGLLQSHLTPRPGSLRGPSLGPKQSPIWHRGIATASTRGGASVAALLRNDDFEQPYSLIPSNLTPGNSHSIIARSAPANSLCFLDEAEAGILSWRPIRHSSQHRQGAKVREFERLRLKLLRRESGLLPDGTKGCCSTVCRLA